jgi:hypothetical protein
MSTEDPYPDPYPVGMPDPFAAEAAVCGRSNWAWPWWCSRPKAHTGPCALWRKPWRLGGRRG